MQFWLLFRQQLLPTNLSSTDNRLTVMRLSQYVGVVILQVVFRGQLKVRHPSGRIRSVGCSNRKDMFLSWSFILSGANTFLFLYPHCGHVLEYHDFGVAIEKRPFLPRCIEDVHCVWEAEELDHDSLPDAAFHRVSLERIFNFYMVVFILAYHFRKPVL